MAETVPTCLPAPRGLPRPLIAARNIVVFLLRSPPSAFGLAVLALLILMAVFAPLLATHDPYAQDLMATLQPPGAAHFFGTDELGRDIYSRLLYGARITLTIITLVTVIVGPIGLLVGTAAGYFGGWLDTVLMRVTDIFLSFPGLILSLAFVAALGPSLNNAIIAIALTSWPPIARLARAETLTFRSADYVSAARLQGASAGADHLEVDHADVHALGPDPPDAEHGDGDPDRGGPRLPRPRRPAAAARMGRDDRHRPPLHDRQLVARDLPGRRHPARQPRLQSPRRRPARRARPQADEPEVTGMAQDPILDVRNLSVRYRGASGEVPAVRDVSFTLGRERLGIVGESGSGKSTVGRALLRLLPTARITADRMRFEDVDLLTLSEKQMLHVRGRRISMILQDPKFSLNPIQRVGDQVSEAYLTHFRCSRAEARAKALEMLSAVQIRDPERVYALYPHEISGGMGQRVMIAMMLLTDPDLVIADEPTSALDVTIRLQVLGILDRLVRERGIGLIMISHDLNLVRNFCDRVLIMYAGRVLESLPAAELDQRRASLHAGADRRAAAVSAAAARRSPCCSAARNGKPRWECRHEGRPRREPVDHPRRGRSGGDDPAQRLVRGGGRRMLRPRRRSRARASPRCCAACRC